MRIWACAALSVSAVFAATPEPAVTFHKDVLPVLQKNCQSCHRPGEAAPMSFLTYEQTRPWAKAIKQAVNNHKMPPWFADPHVGKFANDRTLDSAAIATLSRWADSGAPAGDARDAPAPAVFTEGWAIGKPDLVLEMPKPIDVPARGTIEYQYIVMPTGLKEDMWVQAAEARPGNREVVHHIIAFIREPGSKWLKDAVPGVPFVPPARKPGEKSQEDEVFDDNLAGYAPGLPAVTFEPGQARLLKAGSDIVLQMHYTANGKPHQDQSKVGVIFAKQPPRERIITVWNMNSKFEIPAGAPNHRVDSTLTLHAPSRLIGLLPHMHLRGKSFSYRAVYPDGRTEDLLNVPRYDFNWQLWYLLAEKRELPPGTRIECVAHFDNSPNNPANPDPKAAVHFGEQSWEEMMIGFLEIAIDPNLPKVDLYRPRKTSQVRTAKVGE